MTAARIDARAVGALAAATALAWTALATWGGEGMEAPRFAPFLVAWTLMMVAMMVPSAAPLVLLYRRPGRGRLVAGYVLVWAAFGVPVYALARAVDLMELPSLAIAAVLAAAGTYQLTPLKTACLRRCRSPLDFLALRWGRGPLRLGGEHGAYCVGCCWGLMAVLILAAAMHVAAAALIAAVVFAEKVLPRGEWTARAAGAALFAAAAVVLV